MLFDSSVGSGEHFNTVFSREAILSASSSEEASLSISMKAITRRVFRRSNSRALRNKTSRAFTSVRLNAALLTGAKRGASRPRILNISKNFAEFMLLYIQDGVMSAREPLKLAPGENIGL